MTGETLYGICSLPFEAARRVSGLGRKHPSGRLHGHSFLATARVRVQPGSEPMDLALIEAAADLERVVEPLNYCFLNDYLTTPTDENLARYVRSEWHGCALSTVGIQSTRTQGVDSDENEVAHVWRKFRFEAAHRLPNVPTGHPCGRMHGHGFEVVLHARESVSGKFMAVDFDHIAEVWKPIDQILNNQCLNHIPGLENPTSEMIAAWIWERIKPSLDSLSWVTVYETTTAGCHFDGKDYRIWKQQRFESAVRMYVDSGCSRGALHGHSYLIRLHLTAPLDRCMGWTVDYGDVKEAFHPVYEQLDHQALHEIPSLEQPGLEAILRWIRSQVSNVLPQLDQIDLFERPMRGATLSWATSPLPPFAGVKT